MSPARKKIDQTLLYACRKGNLEAVMEALDSRANPEAKDIVGYTPLYWAIFKNNIRITRLLLERGANPNAQATKDGETPLHLAVRIAVETGNTNMVRLILDHGAQPDMQDNYGWTPLHRATNSGHANVVRLLLDRGANPNVQNYYGWTPLHQAANNGYVGIALLLLKHDAKPDVKTKDGRTPADVAQKPEIRSLLQAHALDIRLRQEYQEVTKPKDVQDLLDRPEMAL